MRYCLTFLVVICAALLADLPAKGAQQPVAAPDRTDVFGDALPKGAVARLGSVRFHHEGGLIAAAFSPDAKTVLAAGFDKKGGLSLRFWETSTGTEVNRITVKGTNLTGMTFAPDGKSLFLGVNSSVEQYDCQTGKLVHSFAAKGNLHGFVSFAVSPDGKWLATNSESQEMHYSPMVHIWEIATGKERKALKGQRGTFIKCQWSADGKRIMCASGHMAINYGNGKEERIKGSIFVWDATTGKKLHEIENNEYNVAFAADGQTVALQPQTGETRIVDIPAGKTICTVEVSQSMMEFTSDSKRLVTVSYSRDDEPCMWDATTGKLVQRFENQASSSRSHRLVGLSPDGKLLAGMAGGWNVDGSVLLWNVADGKAIHHDGGHSDAVTAVAFSPDGSLVASGSADCTVRLWNSLTGKHLTKLAGHTTAITALAFAGDGKTLASSSADGRIRLWETAGRRELAKLDGVAPGAACLSFSPDNRKLIVGSKAHTLDVWDLASFKKISSAATGQDGKVFAISRDGKLALSGNGEDPFDLPREKLHLWKLPAGTHSLSVDLRNGQKNQDNVVCWTAAISAGSQLFAASHSRASMTLRGQMYADDTVRVFEAGTGQEWLKLPGIKVHALSFSPDGRFLVAGHGNTLTFHNRSTDSRVTIWDMASGDKVREWQGHANEVTCVAFSANANLAASGSADHTILIWKEARPAASKAGAERATAKQLQTWWDELGSKTPASQAAVAKLVAHPQETVPWIGGENLKPVSPSKSVTERITKLIKALDSAVFAERREAFAALEGLGSLAEPQFQSALAGNLPLEPRRRVEQLLAKLDTTTPERLRIMRGVLVLEWIGGAEAEKVLATLAGGAPGCYVTQLGQAALARMRASGS